MEKLNYSEMAKIFKEHNRVNNITSQLDDPHPIYGVIVYKSDNWLKENFSLLSRSYKVRNDNKPYIENMLGRSIFGNSLDGMERNVRLDWYSWEIDYCYILEEEN